MAYEQLSERERERILELRAKGLGPTAIGSSLGRNKGTISRELKRNSAPVATPPERLMSVPKLVVATARLRARWLAPRCSKRCVRDSGSVGLPIKLWGAGGWPVEWLRDDSSPDKPSTVGGLATAQKPLFCGRICDTDATAVAAVGCEEFRSPTASASTFVRLKSLIVSRSGTGKATRWWVRNNRVIWSLWWSDRRDCCWSSRRRASMPLS